MRRRNLAAVLVGLLAVSLAMATPVQTAPTFRDLLRASNKAADDIKQVRWFLDRPDFAKSQIDLEKENLALVALNVANKDIHDYLVLNGPTVLVDHYGHVFLYTAVPIRPPTMDRVNKGWRVTEPRDGDKS